MSRASCGIFVRPSTRWTPACRSMRDNSCRSPKVRLRLLAPIARPGGDRHGRLKPKKIQRRKDFMQLSLGPMLYNWAPERWRDFYFRIADEAPIDTVVIGEIVCSKRLPFIAPH